MKVTVDDDRCRGHAVCCSICPDVFRLTEHGYAAAIEGDVPSEHEENVAFAAEVCPEQAITVH